LSVPSMANDLRRSVFTLCLLMVGVLVACTGDRAAQPAEQGSQAKRVPAGVFQFQLSVDLPADPETVFDTVTGDISSWWDHTMSKNPARFVLEPRPGGGFWEYFDESGTNGVRHAVVIYADRGKMLRFEGPLGLSGQAITMVTTYTFQAKGTGTVLTVEVHAAGEMTPDLKDVVQGVWRHFLFERLKPHMEKAQAGS